MFTNCQITLKILGSDMTLNGTSDILDREWGIQVILNPRPKIPEVQKQSVFSRL